MLPPVMVQSSESAITIRWSLCPSSKTPLYSKFCFGTVIEFSPKTGRTHQLRLHSAFSLNAPIIGDDLYGAPRNMDATLKSVLTTKNLFLFAYKLTFRHPTSGKIMVFRAPVPEFMKPVMDLLELQIP